MLNYKSISWLQGSFNIHLIALCCISFVVVSAFLLFDLDERFYPKQTQHAASIDYSEANQTIIPEPVLQTEISNKESIPKPAPKQVSPRIQNEPKSRLIELESRQFTLNLSGEAYVAGMLKDANLILKLEPIKGTELQNFKVIESRLILDGTGVPITGISAELDQRMITLEFTGNNVGKFSISGTLDEPILDDANNKQNVVIQDQDFYLLKREMPYRLDLIGTLSS